MAADVPALEVPVTGHRPNGSIHKMPSSSTLGDDDENMTFDSSQEEAAHYREKYRRILDMLDETRAELDEFQASSKELEDELEKELAATDKQQAELKEKIKRLEAEKDEWKAKHVALQKLHSSTTGAMQREMDNLRSERDKTLVALRDLEMGNDELERNERVAVSSLLDLESKYNRAIEEKTLLEQEIVQKQELEEECQRLKDDVRDANNEITILKDQLTRAVPTPPSSVSVSMSPVQEASRELSHLDISAHTPDDMQLNAPIVPRPARTPEPPLRHSTLTRSNTASSIPTLSPAAKRYSSRLAESPSGLSHLARSTTSRNLASAAASPALNRSRNGAPARTPINNPNLAAKTKGFKLLHDLQARLKATDDKLGNRVPKRLVSGTIPLGFAKRAASTSRATAPPDARLAELAKSATPMAEAGDTTGATFLSPNGWVMVSDQEDTPTNPVAGGFKEREPPSPLASNFRSTSSASNKPLPTRPGIPSPLAANLTRSTSRMPRPPSRGPGSAFSTRPSSRQTMDGSRPMSPASLLHSTRAQIRSPTPTFGQAISAASSAASTRPSSRTAHRTLGRGPPPASRDFPTAQPLSMSVSTSTPSAMRRSSRRSSLGGPEAGLAPSGIPAPKRSPGRPISVPVFADGTPPPVPRIPSAHLRASSRDKLGESISRHR